jgi:hypothetical protein
MDLKVIWQEALHLKHLVQNRNQWWAFGNSVIIISVA